MQNRIKFSSVIESEKPYKGEEAQILIRAARKLAALGVTPQRSGNLSILTDSGILITSAGAKLERIKKEQLVLLRGYSAKKNEAKVRGKCQPSIETPTHWLIYRTYHSAKAVMHCHDYEVLRKAHHLSLPIADAIEPGTAELAEEVVEKLKEGDYIVIRSHGQVCIGKSFKLCLRKIKQIRREALIL